MKRTGEILKKAREQKGLSINEIALSLKIGSKILKAIEDGDDSQLPAKTFLRGFVQSYASFLRLDVNEVLQIFQDEMGTTKPKPLIQMPEQDATLESFEKKNNENSASHGPTPAHQKSFKSLTKTNNNSKTLTFSFLGLLLVGLIVFTKKMIDKYQKEGAVSEVEVMTPLANPPTETAAEVIPNPSPAATAMSTPLATPTPFNTPPPTATPKPSATPTPESTPVPTPAPSPSISPSPSATPSGKPVEVLIEALDNVEITYITNDGKTEKITLRAEQVHTFKSKSGFKLNISNGGAINVIVNGKDLGIPGNLGKPVKLTF
jgi:cytoskeleton protein RodZ